MKPYTKHIKTHYKKDFTAIQRHNNSKYNKRTQEQREQHLNDKKAYYKNKWESLLEDCTTPTQKHYCIKMLDFIEIYTR